MPSCFPTVPLQGSAPTVNGLCDDETGGQNSGLSTIHRGETEPFLPLFVEFSGSLNRMECGALPVS